MENEFYVRDTRSNCGSTCMFWAKDGKGYVTDLDKAEVFDFERAQKFADEKRHFIPLSKKRVDEVSTIRVDMQYLELNVDFSEGIIVGKNVGYDGNDIFFDDGKGGTTANYEEAKIYQSGEDIEARAKTGFALSKKFLDSICRPTLQAKNVNHRKMMTSAGIRYRKPRKRQDSGKHRHNCPACGKIVWDYNPYEAPTCSDFCEIEMKHRPVY